MVEQIDKTRLDNDTHYRFEYLSKFFDFTSNDIKILNQMSIYIQPRIPIIVDIVYRKLFSFDITKQYFHIRHSCFKNLFTSIDKSSLPFHHCQQLEYRKNMLSEYLKRIFTEKEWNDSFIEYLSYVGQIHTNRIGSPAIHVDYIHLNALIGFIEQNIIDIIWKIDEINQQTKHTAILAVNKLFWIQNEFF